MELIFSVVFVLTMSLLICLPLYFKLKNHKSSKEWEEIKRQNYSKMETTSKQDPDKGLYVTGSDPY